MLYTEMQISDYDEVIALWRRCEGVKLRGADSREGIAVYLERNPGLSFIARYEGELIGTVMAGHDGKRGYVQHLAVDDTCRQQGAGTELVNRCLNALADKGILKSHIHVLSDNHMAKAFWSARGWQRREDIEVFSFINSADENC